MDRIGFVAHKGKQVLVLNFTNCPPEEVKAVADKVEQVVAAQPKNSVLLVADFSGAQFNKDAVTRLKIATTRDRPFVKRAAWVCPDNLPEVLFDSIKRFSQREFPTFSTLEQALDFVVLEQA